MVAILISLGLGGATGGVLGGVFTKPLTDLLLSFSLHSLKKLARGDHLSKEERQFIKEYNRRRMIYKGHDYTEQLKNKRMMSGW